MPCLDTENTPLPGDTENVLLRKLLNRLCNVTSGGGGGVSQAYVDARDAATLASANANAVAGDVATLAAAMSSASALYVLKSGDTMTGALLLPNGAVGAPSLSHAADANTGLWYPAADTIAFSTAGAERIRILSTGFVGIGTDTPSAFLSLMSATGGNMFAMQGAGTNAEYLTFNSTGGTSYFGMESSVGGANFTGSSAYSLVLSAAASRKLHLGFNGGNGVALTVDNSGNVGIGIAAPLAKLHITPAASGTDYFRIDHSDGTPRLQVGALTGAVTYGALWLGNITPDATNYGLANNGATTFLNADTGGVINFSIAGVSILNVSSSGLLFAPDNTYDIGAVGASRPQDVHVARTVDTLNLTLRTAGLFSVTSGANQRAGNAVLVAGTVTVANTTVTANTIVMLTRKTSGGTLGTAITYTVTAATDFTITSDSALDTSTFSYFLIEVP